MQKQQSKINKAYSRTIKDIAYIIRNPNLYQHFQYNNQQSLHDKKLQTQKICFDYFYFSKDNRTLNKTFKYTVTFIVDQQYPFSKPKMIIKESHSSQMNQFLVNINDNLNKYLQTEWQQTSQLHCLLDQFVHHVKLLFVKSLTQKPFKIQYENYDQKSQLWQQDIASKQPSLKNKRMNKKNKPNFVSSSIQTKNLNRHFRSKLRQILRFEVQTNPSNQKQLLLNYFKPNRVGFKQIRHALKTQWFNKILKQQMKNGQFLKRILLSTMNVQSKMLMLKYYPIMQEAVQDPKNFIRWKY